jgi:hypothetical protein
MATEKKSDLELLLAYYEEEKQSLEKMIANSLKEHDYLIAHYHFNALGIADDHLRVLNGFKRPHYDEERQIEIMQYLLFNLKDEILRSCWMDEIESRKKKLNLLGNEKIKPAIDDQQIDDALFDLYEGRIKAFQLHISEEEHNYFNFEMIKNNFLQISINRAILNLDYDLDDVEAGPKNPPHPLMRLGFTLNLIEDTFIFSYCMDNFRNAILIKKLLARFFYDILGSANLIIPFLRIINIQ